MVTKLVKNDTINSKIMRNKGIRCFAFVCVIGIFAAFNANTQINPGVDFDLHGFINQKLSSGEKNIVIPPGRYRLAEFNNTHIYIGGKSDFTIIGDSVEIICTETVPAIKLKNCSNFKIQGISIDYDPLPFTQGQIVEMSVDKKSLTVDLIDGYSTTLTGDKVEIFDSITGELSTSTYYGVTYVVDKTERRAVLTKPSNYQLVNSHEKVGDIVVIGSKSNKSSPHAILPDGCTNMVLENVTIYAGPTFGFFEQNCSGSQYINCKVDRRPLATEIKQRGVKRMRSNNADAFHSKHALIGPKYIQCLAHYHGDDGIAINGDYHVILTTNGSRLSVAGKGGNTPNLTVGDSVELVSYNGDRVKDAKIIKISDGPALTSTEKNFLQTQKFHGAASNTYKASKVYYITLDHAVDLPMGSLIASANRIGNGFEVRDCTMGPNRSRGILVKASNGIIAGNTLIGNRGEAIKVAPEYNWLEAGSGSNVTVSNNNITECFNTAIAIYAYGGNGEIAPAGAHKNITVTHNTISGSANPAIALTSIRGLVLENNTIESTNNDLLVPWVMNNFGRKEDLSREIYMKNVVVEPEEIVDVSMKEYPSTKVSSIEVNNPFSDQLTLESVNSESVKYSIYDLMGREVFSSSTQLEISINTSHWQKGLYVLKIDGMPESVKLLKQ